MRPLAVVVRSPPPGFRSTSHTRCSGCSAGLTEMYSCRTTCQRPSQKLRAVGERKSTRPSRPSNNAGARSLCLPGFRLSQRARSIRLGAMPMVKVKMSSHGGACASTGCSCQVGCIGNARSGLAYSAW
ncbi:hypothetical protein D9M68_554120 [compost metagenome]